MASASSDEEIEYVWDNVVEPDRSKGDFYCRLCRAHMNCQDNWDLHIIGKRHIKNSMKFPGDRPSGIKSQPVDSQPQILKLLENIDEPIVGLGFMGELQRGPDNNLYTCYLCKSTDYNSTVVRHITSTKHRLNYLKVVDLAGYELIQNMPKNKRIKDSIVSDKVAEWQAKVGHGTIDVKAEVISVGGIIEQGLMRSRSLDQNDDKEEESPNYYTKDYECCIDTEDISSFDIETKVRMLEELSSIPITSSGEEKAVKSLLESLENCLMQYKLNSLPQVQRPAHIPSERISYITTTPSTTFACDDMPSGNSFQDESPGIWRTMTSSKEMEYET